MTTHAASSPNANLRRPLLGGVLAFLIFLPNFVWMIRHDFPFFELLANIRADQRNVALSPLEFIGQQPLFLNPLTLPLWLAGLGWFFADARGRSYRFLAWAYLITLVLLLVTDGRVYYLAPAYPALFAGGAVAIEGWAGQPALENDPTGVLPLLFADRFGWPEQVQAVAKAYQALPPEVRANTAIWGNTYQQAGAVDFFGPALGLPKAIGGHLNYWYWGPRGYTGESVLTLGEKLGDLSPLFAKCERVGVVSHPYSMPRQRFPIYWCRGMKQSLQELWPQVKKWD